MIEDKRILVLLAHPDDEILGTGGTLAYYAKQWAYTELICATRGEVGEISDPTLATPDTLGEVREQELMGSARALGIKQVTFLDFRDSGMDGSPENNNPLAFINRPVEEVVPKLVEAIRRLRPHILITFEPYGGYGHPDHIAIHHHTWEALHAAADADYLPELGPTWQASRLFYQIVTWELFEAMRQKMEAKGLDTSFFSNLQERRQNPKAWPGHWHCRMDISKMLDNKWRAFESHRTQFGEQSLFRRLSPEEMKEVMRYEYFFQAWPELALDARLEDLFDGLSD